MGRQLVYEEGNEFYLKRANAYIPTNKELPFYAMIQAGQLRDHLIVGQSFGEDVVLNPSKFERLSLKDKDRLIVVAKQ